MPFVKKNDSQGSQSPTDVSKIFIGRTGELLFFVQNILKPEYPSHNIISISGQGGVGKSTLLARFVDKAHSTSFKDYCLTAMVDERQTTPASMMEKFADQLRIKGKFERALKQYKETLRKLRTQRETPLDTLSRGLPDFAGAAVESVPIAGPLLRESVKAGTKHLLVRHHTDQVHRDAEVLEDPTDDLTKAFVEELNHLAEPRTMLSTRRVKGLRVILFFDTFEQLAVEAAPWLLDYFLEAKIENNVVLVIAGRDPIEQSIPNGHKRWLPYHDSQTIYSISLDGFTKEETRLYLAARSISAQTQIETIWELSQGLPLYLSLLTSNRDAKLDPTKDVVSNFLRWIPQKDSIKRQLALDVALLNKPFNQDDLEAFPYVDKQQSSALYQWLISQPFIQSSYQDGQCTYHELAQILFCRHLLQRSEKEYSSKRRILIDYYRELIESIQHEEFEIILNSALEGRVIRYSIKWLKLAMELAYQSFLLPDTASQIGAIEYILDAYEYTEETGEIIKVLRELSQEQFNNQITPFAQESVKILLQYIEADWPSINSSWSKYKQESLKELLRATDTLLQHLIRLPSIKKQVLAYVYRKRGFVYRNCKKYELAIDDYNFALKMYPLYARAYASRGSVNRLLGRYDQAIQDYDHAIELEPKYAWAYIGRGETHRLCKDYAKSIDDLSRAIELEPKYAWAYTQRGIAFREIGRLSDALIDFNSAIKLLHDDSRVYYERGETHRLCKDYAKSIDDLIQAIELEPKYAWAYNKLGWLYILVKNCRQAMINYNHAFELNPTFIEAAWMAQWSRMCQERPSSRDADILKKIASIDSAHYIAYICHSIALWLHRTKLSHEVLSQVEHAILLQPEKWDAYFWKGVLCASFERNAEAQTALEQAMEIGLPSILLAPLYWLENENPVFYQEYVVPLLAKIN